MERGHALARYQDTWLGELVQELERDGVLENTIIVVTADHGLRRVPSLQGGLPRNLSQGTLDDLAVRVPLLIYAPRVLKQSVKIEFPTSHVDIAPTILDMLGIASGRNLEQGVSVLNPRLRGRRLFLQVQGADGFFQGGNYYMRGGASGVSRSNRVQFEDRDVLAFGGREAIQVRQILTEQANLQHALLLRLVGNMPIQ
jgi:arylsulfatase A-like enzyme